MMKRVLFLFLALGIAASCNKDFGDINVDKKQPSKVPAGSLFASASVNLADAMTSTNVNNNIYRMLAQQWTETTYTDEANYDLVTRNIPQNFWNSIFTGVLKNLDESKKLIAEAGETAEVAKNQEACIEILNVYTYAVLVNNFGDIPYSQALDVINVYPKYDNAAEIYADLTRRLDQAINNIDAGASGFGASDLLMHDDMAAWKTFGNSLKLRLGMILADHDANKAKQMVEAAAAGAISSNAGNVVFQYLSNPPYTNPVWDDLVQSGRKDFVAANTLVDAMKALSDPRVPAYFTTDASGTDYVGGIYAASNNYATYSKPAEALTAPDYGSTLFDYAEVRFILAEAAARGWSVGGTAAEHYEAAIRASMEQWGVSSADADTYLARTDVAYATATGDWKQKIGTQKWIALYNRGFDAWTEWRRFDYPILNVPTGKTYADIPRRLTYPVQEQNLNKSNYTAAASAIGGDLVQTRLFWDKQ
jgi:hypothetical protein